MDRKDAVQGGAAWATFTASGCDFRPSLKPSWRERWNCWRGRHVWSDLGFKVAVLIVGPRATEVPVATRGCLFCRETLWGDEALRPEPHHPEQRR